MIKTKETPSKETYTVRQPILRKGKPIESCTFEGNNLEQHIILIITTT